MDIVLRFAALTLLIHAKLGARATVGVGRIRESRSARDIQR